MRFSGTLIATSRSSSRASRITGLPGRDDLPRLGVDRGDHAVLGRDAASRSRLVLRHRELRLRLLELRAVGVRARCASASSAERADELLREAGSGSARTRPCAKRYSVSAAATCAFAASACRPTSAGSSRASTWPFFTRAPTSTLRATILPPMRNARSASWRGFTSPANTAVSAVAAQRRPARAATGRTASAAASCLRAASAASAARAPATQRSAIVTVALGRVSGARADRAAARARAARARARPDSATRTTGGAPAPAIAHATARPAGARTSATGR